MAIRTRDLSDPVDLGPAVALAHRAVQMLSLATRANLAPVPDDSHSSLIWDAQRAMFLSQPIGRAQIALSLADLTLVCLQDGAVAAQYPLAGRREVEAADWLDQFLQTNGLRPTAQADLPYALPQQAAAPARFPDALPGALRTLAIWYTLAAGTLEQLRATIANLSPGPVRVWPHHFDIATYVSVEPGDAETARGIGVGLSPGDDSYAEPYFYVNPWPAPDPARLGDAPAPGHLHLDGFVGFIATADEITSLNDIEDGTDRFVRTAFTSARNALGL